MTEFDPDTLRGIQQQLNDKVGQGSLRQQSKTRYSNLNEQRREAGRGDAKRFEPTFLRPQDIQKGVDYDVERVFYTTLGNDIRLVTRDDLIAFQKNIELLQNQYTKGITAKQVINLSLPYDIEKSNKQIFMAVPLSIKNGVIHFMTNASRESAVTEHHVNVEFMQYSTLVMQPVAVGKDQIRKLANGKLKFECDCGRHTYWFRYIASIGGYGYGRQEEGYPKITNPNLAGVACKHVLRVMAYIQSPMFNQYISQQIEKERKTQNGLRRKQTQKQLTKEISQQLDVLESKTAKVIVRNEKAAQRELLRRANNLAKSKLKEAQKQQRKELQRIAKEQGHKAAEVILYKQKQDAIRRLDSLLAMKLITPEQYAMFKQGIK